MEKVLIGQGTTPVFRIRLTDREGNVITPNVVSIFQFILVATGLINIEIPQDKLEFDEENEMFIVRLSEAQTLRIKGNIKYQVRIKFTNGNIDETTQHFAESLGILDARPLKGD